MKIKNLNELKIYGQDKTNFNIKFKDSTNNIYAFYIAVDNIYFDLLEFLEDVKKHNIHNRKIEELYENNIKLFEKFLIIKYFDEIEKKYNQIKNKCGRISL